MKIQYISSACVLVEHDGCRVLCDPWLTDGIYYGSWHHYPPLAYTPESFAGVDYIYISHIHPDHMDPQTLNRLPKSIPVVIHDFEEKFIFRILKQLGFETIVELKHKEKHQLANDFSIEILAADNCDPQLCGRLVGCMSHPYEKTLQIDTMAVFQGGDQTFVNTNDCPYDLSHDVCNYVVSSYRTVDFLAVGYSGAGPYPQCFENLSREEQILRGAEKRERFLQQAVSYLKHLKPSYFLPFAGQYTLGGTLAPLNELRGVPELEDLPVLFAPRLMQQGIDSRLVQLNSGASFDLETSESSSAFIPPNPEDRSKYISDVLANRKLSYQGEFLISESEWTDLTPRLLEAQERMLRRMQRANFTSNWKTYLSAGQGYLYCVPYDGSPIHKVDVGSEEQPFVRIDLDYSLLVMILNRQAHWNNAEIGSHLRFFRQPDVYDRAIYYFLYFLHC